ncbi:MAG: hypothetical protein ABI591_16850, partial [Kofleriaceae bacterium]
YALLVDRGPHAQTRKAAANPLWAEVRYAYAVDKALPPALIERMLKGAYANEDLEVMQDALAALGGVVPERRESDLATRKLPKRPAKPLARIADAIADAEVRSDIDEMTERGLARIGASPDDGASEAIDKLHRYVDRIRDGAVKLGKKPNVARLELACAFAEQLHRAFAWQWTKTPDGVSIASPTGSHTILLTPMFERIAKPDASSNTIALQFNMIAAGKLPKAKRNAFVGLS